MEIGLDVLAEAKRGGKADGVFKVPKDKMSSIAASMDEEVSELSEVDDVGINGSSKVGNTNRKYRDHGVSHTPHSGTSFEINVMIA